MAIPTEAMLQEAVVLKKSIPISFAFSRLEVRPRSENFERALKAEVRDALWMLTKQWQIGEFEGDDAGSPLTAKLCTTTGTIHKYRAAENPVQLFDKEIAFETQVEQRALPFATLEQDLSLDLRLLMGRRWFQLLGKKTLLDPATKKFFLDHYAFTKPDPTLETHAAYCADIEVWQQFAAVAGRMMDGGRLYSEIIQPGGATYFDLAVFPQPLKKADFQLANDEFKNWFNYLFTQPTDPDDNAWKPKQLEYQFGIAAGTEQGEKTMKAEEYYHGHLDWYNLDVDNAHALGGNINAEPTVKKVHTMIPAPVMFEGMPNNRWWAFEESRTNFNYLKPDTPDIAKLVVAEFALVYANDWYLIPYKLPTGSITRVKALAVTNVFGEKFWIEAAGKGDNEDKQKWNMFSMNVLGDAPAPTDNDLLLLPTVPRIQQGRPVEEVAFVRDEMANMVWGVETIVPLPSGISKPGNEAAASYHSFLQKLVGPLPPPVSVPAPAGAEVPKIRYEIMNSIPENWIPFIPTHVTGSNRQVQLQRAAMPRILEGAINPPGKIRPRTFLLQEGLKDKKAYFIHEEEVPRSGVLVSQSYQRTRWSNGRIFVWYGVQKTTGRGEGSSGLGFDRIVERK